MGRKAEQLTSVTTPSMRRQAKRDAVRARRRSERIDPENAPVRLRELIRGWAD